MLLPTLLANFSEFAADTIVSSLATLPDANASTCANIGQCRTVRSIIWSCLGTIFACIWVAIHPNVPKLYPPRKRWSRAWWGDTMATLLAKLGVAWYAMRVPEYIFTWALRQRLQAQELAKMCQDAAADERARGVRTQLLANLRAMAGKELHRAGLLPDEVDKESEGLQDPAPSDETSARLIDEGDGILPPPRSSALNERYLRAVQTASALHDSEPSPEPYGIGECPGNKR